MRTVLYGNCAVLYQFCLPFVKPRGEELMGF